MSALLMGQKNCKIIFMHLDSIYENCVYCVKICRGFAKKKRKKYERTELLGKITKKETPAMYEVTKKI